MEGLEERNNMFCICGYAIFFFGLDFETVGTNLQTFGSFFSVSYTDTKLDDIFGFQLIFFDIANILNVYRPIFIHKRNENRFFIFILVEYIKV